ncbi:hypothetical protein [Chroococcidiopsis sp. CCNUC1]|uniref:hypothetical protein n=1 Tax=Chroococcidiopsis sp. CCNUC1 TaxID=2653189 RepID=UPI00201FE063|nr:hypothetical protein [Chroococcidiopsis sp. CCNUC1]URD52608.1 hypothetical protein M5J74_11560 [Chroococcidiopsis sp. CCNUC1]
MTKTEPVVETTRISNANGRSLRILLLISQCEEGRKKHITYGRNSRLSYQLA